MTRTRSVTVGYVILAILGLFDAISLLQGGEDAPPFVIALISTILGLITLVALYFVWSQRRAPAPERRAVLTVIVSRAASALFSIPAFFVDIAGGIKVVVAVFIVLTGVGIQLVRPELEGGRSAGAAAR